MQRRCGRNERPYPSLVRTVSRYLLREFAIASTTVFLALLVTWIAADTLLHIERLTGDTVSTLRSILFASLDVIPLGVPMACLVGVVWSLSRAVRSREITAIRSGGIPLQRALTPIVLCSAAVAAGLGLVQDRVLIPARQALHEARLTEESGGRGIPQRIHDRWWYSDGEFIFSAGDFEAGELRDVTLFQLDGAGRIVQRIEAETAKNTDGGTWEFRDARIFDFGSDGALVQEYEPLLELELELRGRDLARAEQPPELATLGALWRSIRRAPVEHPDGSALRIVFHSRLAQPAAVLILVLLAIPFAIGDSERSDSLARALLFSLGSAATYWMAWAVGLLAGRVGVVPAFLPVWTVAVAGLAVGGWRFRKLQQ